MNARFLNAEKRKELLKVLARAAETEAYHAECELERIEAFSARGLADVPEGTRLKFQRVAREMRREAGNLIRTAALEDEDIVTIRKQFLVGDPEKSYEGYLPMWERLHLEYEERAKAARGDRKASFEKEAACYAVAYGLAMNRLATLEESEAGGEGARGATDGTATSIKKSKSIKKSNKRARS